MDEQDILKLIFLPLMHSNVLNEAELAIRAAHLPQ
ncbi:hypothetical protein M2243_002295 [Heliophilum fasciatum]|nr:hypothetical protein [Heliophilum fasciatum]